MSIEVWMHQYDSTGPISRSTYQGRTLVWQTQDPENGNYIIPGVLKHEINKAERFEFDILPSNTHYNSIKRFVTYFEVIDTTSEINNIIMFYGRVRTISKDFDRTKHVVCEGLLANLMDAPLFQRTNSKQAVDVNTVGSNSSTARNLFVNAIACYNLILNRDDIDSSLDDCDVSFTNSEDGLTFKNAVDKQVGDFIYNDLVASYGGFIEPVYDVDTFAQGDHRITGRITWHADPADTAYSPIVANQNMEFGLNLLDASFDVSDDDPVSGYIIKYDDNGEEIFDTTAIVDSNGTTYIPYYIGNSLTAVKSVSIPGLKSSTKKQEMYDIAERFRSRYGINNLDLEKPDTMTLNVLDLHYFGNPELDSYSIGREAHVIIPHHQIDGNYLITSTEIYISDMTKNQYTVGIYHPTANGNEKVLSHYIGG